MLLFSLFHDDGAHLADAVLLLFQIAGSYRLFIARDALKMDKGISLSDQLYEHNYYECPD